MKESLDILVLVRSLAQMIENAKVNGVVDWFDLLKFGEAKKFATEALKGAQNIPAELLDMDAEELKILLEGLLDALTKFVQAVRK